MKPLDIERILRDDPEITPSPDFSGRVMRTVHRDIELRGGLEFPWARLVTGLAICTVLTIVGVVISVMRGDPAPAVLEHLARTARQPAITTALVWVPTSLAGAYLMVWWSMRAAGLRR
jgi:hypothetical protein